MIQSPARPISHLGLIAMMLISLAALLVVFTPPQQANAHASCSYSNHSHWHGSHNDIWKHVYTYSNGARRFKNVTHGTYDTASCGGGGCSVADAVATLDHVHRPC